MSCCVRVCACVCACARVCVGGDGVGALVFVSVCVSF